MYSEVQAALDTCGIMCTELRWQIPIVSSYGYVISYGEMLYRCLDAIERLKAQGIHVGLINKPTLNLVDEKMIETLI